MATYKVIQDIEAEDKLLGPLTFRQFIYALVVLVSGFIIFRLALVNPFLAIPLVPHTIFFAVLAAPFGHEQSSEVWLLARIRFFIKPRRRIWDQSGIQELVTITAPKKVERHLVKDLTPTEVTSRLQALANTIDSRGWAVKNVNVNLYGQPSYVTAGASSDRLIDPSAIPREVPGYDVLPSDDILDEYSNPTAQHFEQMISKSSSNRRQQLMDLMHQGAPAPGTASVMPQDNWFAGQKGAQSSTNIKDEDAIAEELRKKREKSEAAYGHTHTVKPLSKQSPEPAKTENKPKDAAPMTSTVDPAILELANNDDLNVATIARQAQKTRQDHSSGDDEVVISLR